MVRRGCAAFQQNDGVPIQFDGVPVVQFARRIRLKNLPADFYPAFGAEGDDAIGFLLVIEDSVKRGDFGAFDDDVVVGVAANIRDSSARI